jgi:hypothetical protein
VECKITGLWGVEKVDSFEMVLIINEILTAGNIKLDTAIIIIIKRSTP